MFQGSCLCGKVRFTLSSAPHSVAHCHCRMCQKQHGAAFATYGNVPREEAAFDSGEGDLSVYQSSPGVQRKFCRHCGSNIQWTSEEHGEWFSFPLTLLDTPFEPGETGELHPESRVSWL